MPRELKDLIIELREDPFRESSPFSADLNDATDRLLQTDGNEEAAARVLSAWLGAHQPCLFGRITARLKGISYCFITESELLKSDEVVHAKIQDERRRWRSKAFAGDSSGFIVLILSARLARAVPDSIVKEMAKRLCFLYLGEDAEDEILLEDVFLRVPGKNDAEIHWKAGVNYFCAQADQRWWHDHRVPGGLGFSVNSVGHLVRSFQIARSSEEMWTKAGLSAQEWSDFKVSSLGQALAYAMQTINGAANAVSGKATYLLQAEGMNAAKVKCPITLPRNVADRDWCEYFGYYHTDITIPSEYFRADVERPAEINGHLLDFTYLFDNRIDNSAFENMGTGIRVRTQSRDLEPRATTQQQRNTQRMFGQEGLISDHESLRSALEAFPID